MNELEIIANIKKIIKNSSALKLEDDVFFDKKNLIASIDTYVENIHYINFKYPDLIIKRLLDPQFQIFYVKEQIQNIY